MPTKRFDYSRTFTGVVMCLGLVFGASCNGGGGGEDAQSFPDTTMEDTGTVDTDQDADPSGCSSDEDCSGSTPACNTETGMCVGCTSNEDCASGEQCDTDANECVATQCGSGSAGESCDPNLDTGQGWSCVDAGKGPVCMRSCSMTGDGAGSSCQGTEICMQTGNSADSAVCFPSQCQGPSDTQNCGNVEQHPRFGSYDNGAKCLQYSEDALVPTEVSNSLEDCGSASLCVPSGTQETGDSCNIATPADCPADATCEACNGSNTCQGGICRSICTSDSECSGTESSCIGLDSPDVVDESTGFCAEPCGPFNGKDDCSNSAEGCKRVTNEIGYCGEVGSKTNMEQCTRGENECAEGFNCLGVRSSAAGVVARCLPECAPSGATDQEVLDNHATCGGTYYGRVAYAHDDPSSVDIYANGNRQVDDLSTGETDAGMNSATEDYFELDVDTLNRGFVEVAVTEGSATDASNPEFTANLTASSGRIETWFVHWNGQLAISPIPTLRDVDQPGMTSGMAKARAGTVVPKFEDGGSTVDVDLVAVPQGGSLSNDAIVLAEGLASEQVAAEFVELAAGSYSLFVFPDSADNQSGNEILELTGLSLEAGDRATFVLHGTTDDSDSVDVSATTIPYASAPAAPRYRCLALGAGHCLNECRASDYGTDWCDEGSACDPLQGSTAASYCLPDGAASQTPGDNCQPSQLGPTCEEGAHCAVDGTGNGTCTSLCIGGEEDSDGFLTCDSGQTCAAGEGALGACRSTCSPGDNDKDSSCPDNLKACITRLAGEGDMEQAFCSPAGNVAQGEECGGSGRPLTSLNQNCEPGSMCAHGTGVTDSLQLALQGMFFHKPPVATGVCRQSVDNPTAPSPTCRQTCDPFADNPGCPDGQACGLDLVNRTASNGVCLEEGDNISSPASEEMCGDNLGKLCGDASYCLPNPQSGGVIRRCFEFCNFDTGEGCTEGTCENVNLGTGIGICRL